LVCCRKSSTAPRRLLSNDIVTEDNAQLLPVREVLRQSQGLCNTTLALLVGVIDVGEPELLSVRQQPQKVSRVLAAGDYKDVADARIYQSLDGVIDHRLLVNRQQMLVGDLG
jgi:hypothetical protein